MKLLTRTPAFYDTHPSSEQRVWDIIRPFIDLIWSLNPSWDDDFLVWDDIVARWLPPTDPLHFQHKDAP